MIDCRSHADTPVKATLLVDAHVHFHECFSWTTFLDGAARNFARARQELGLTSDSAGCLMFTESSGANHYRSMAEQPALAVSLGWRLEKGDDGCSVVLRRSDHDVMMLIAGRQIVTAERLEVLALGCVGELPDGRPIRDVVRAVRDENAIAVIPWGFGKWLGRRGRIVRSMIESVSEMPLCLGDNGGRPSRWPRPATMAWAESQGVVVLGGSDPLPLASHVTRAGSYGFVLDGCPDVSQPASAIKSRIGALRRSPAAFGALSSLSAAMGAQIGLRWQRHRRVDANEGTAVA